MSTSALRVRRRAFTLIELLVAITVLVIIVAVTAQMTNGVSSIVNRGGAHLDDDGQARALLDRMALDFTAMVKRPDVDYYLKGRPASLVQSGNDQIAFYTEVTGYFDPTIDPATLAKTQSQAALVAYRVNARTMCLERLCKGLVWNASPSGNAISFLPVPLASPLPSTPMPSPMPSPYPTPAWPLAAEPDDTITQDPDYEVLGPQVFRFEYYYVLKGQITTNGKATLSIVPWCPSMPGHNSVNGMSDVAGVGVLLAVLDQKSRRLISTAQLSALAKQMPDVPDVSNGGAFNGPGDLEKQWMSAVNTGGLPPSVSAAVRVYTRCFYLNGVPP